MYTVLLSLIMWNLRYYKTFTTFSEGSWYAYPTSTPTLPVSALKFLSLRHWQSTLLLFKKIHQKKEFWPDWDSNPYHLARERKEPISPCSREEIAGALDHSATTTCWEIELNNRIYINLKLATTQKELEIHHGNFLWVSDSLSLPLIQNLLTVFIKKMSEFHSHYRPPSDDLM